MIRFNEPNWEQISKLQNYKPNLEVPKLDYDKISEGMDRRSGYARILFDELLHEIAEFEKQLNPNEEIGVYLASFGGGVSLHIEKIYPRDPYYIVFVGTLNDNQKATLIQHVSQTNILLTSFEIKPYENREARRFGFDTDTK